MKGLRVACSAMGGRIYAGRVNKAGTAMLDGKQDVTSDVLKAIIEKIRPGNTEVVTISGIPSFEISVKELTGYGQQP